MDTFDFPVGAQLAAWQSVLWPQLPKITFLCPKMHIIPLHCTLRYRIVLYGIAWHCVASYGISSKCDKLTAGQLPAMKKSFEDRQVLHVA